MLHNTTAQVVLQIVTCVKKIEVGSDLINFWEVFGGCQLLKLRLLSLATMHQQNGRLPDQKI